MLQLLAAIDAVSRRTDEKIRTEAALPRVQGARVRGNAARIRSVLRTSARLERPVRQAIPGGCGSDGVVVPESR